MTNFILDSDAEWHELYPGGLDRRKIPLGFSKTPFVLTYSIQYATVSRKYSIAAEYCVPDSGYSSVLQILTHGIGFDRSYWDLPFHNYNYSYVDEAVDQYGYATFAYDRPGIGDSIGGDPLTQVQALLEVDALRALTVGLRSGAFKSSGVSSPYKKVVHVGHSFGSQHTYALTAMYPTISDGITLTGFSQDPMGGPYFLLGGNFISANTVPAFSSLPNGYFAAGDVSAVQTNFFAPNQFDPQILAYGYKNGQPVTVGELLSFGGETGSVNNFAGPVHIVTGERDIPYCAGNCLIAYKGYPNIPAASQANFPNAKDFTTTIIPNAGHGCKLMSSQFLLLATNALASEPRVLAPNHLRQHPQLSRAERSCCGQEAW